MKRTLNSSAEMLINLPTSGKKKLRKFICDVDQHETKEKQIKFFLSYCDPRDVTNLMEAAYKIDDGRYTEQNNHVYASLQNKRNFFGVYIH